MHTRYNRHSVIYSQVMRILDNIRPDRQTVMFSATFPRQMEALARRILHKPIEVQVGGRSVVCKEVEQHVVSAYLGMLLILEFKRFFHLIILSEVFYKKLLLVIYEN